MAKTALITGANRGIGLQLLKELTNRGWEVTAAVRDPSRMPPGTPASRVEQADVARDQSIDELAHRWQRPLDLLICNAGIFPREPSLHDFDRNAFLQTMSVNTAGPIALARALKPHLEQGSQRKILNISSQMGSIERNSGSGEFAYRCSKAALNMATKAIANELGPQGFTVAAAHPGWVKTDMGGPDAKLETEQSARALADIAEGLSPESNGRLLDLDGSVMPY